MAQMFFCQCEVCGSRFFSKKEGATVCIKKSTCRVKLSRMKKKAQHEAERMMLDAETYATFQQVISIKPLTEHWLSLMLSQFGKEAFTLMMNGIIVGLLEGQS